MKKTARLVVPAALAMALVTASMAGLGAPADAAPADDRPNVVLILMDDADAKVLEYMDATQTLIADQGATLTNFLYNQPTCCPSRATILRGQYSHNTGVTSNFLPDGGYAAFVDHGNEASTLGTWFQDARYATAFLGKYFNGYAKDTELGNKHVPVGWDRWFGLLEDDGSRYYNFPVNDQGKVVKYTGPENYGTDVLKAEALEFIGTRPDDEAFFMEVAVRAPHGPAEPAERHEGMFEDATYPRSPAFNEVNVRDKPKEIRKLEPLTNAEIAEIDIAYGDRLETVQAVDQMIAEIVALLDAKDELDDTYVVVASDNGYHLGEHRIRQGKNTPYEEDIRVPLFIRGPGIAPGQVINQLVGNVDLAPTLAAAAGIAPPAFVDGRNFLPLVQGGTVPWRNWYLLGRHQKGDDGYVGVRTAEFTFVEYKTEEGEFYDLRPGRDPDQLHNDYAEMPANLKAAFHDQLEALRTCSADACRLAEEAPPPVVP